MQQKMVCGWFTRIGLLLLMQVFVIVPSQNASQRRLHETHTAPFRYVICGNEMGAIGSRQVTVLLDPVAFTEENLKKLFYLVAKRFPEPAPLLVWVKTSLWQIETPEENELPKMSDVGDDPHSDQFPQALLMRTNGNELFRYSSDEKPPYRRLKTVILKGRDPFDTTRK